MLREDIKDVRRDGYGCAESTEAVHAPTKCDASPFKLMLERLTEEDQSSDSEDPGRVDAPEAIFGLVLAAVGANVPVAEEVVEPVAPELCAHGADHRCEEEEGSCRVTEEVWRWFDELSDRAGNC